MALIRRGLVPFALEDMTQVAAAVGADNLDAQHAQRTVRVPGDGAGDAVVVGGPATAGLELVVRLVQWCIAAGAGVDARLRCVLVILAGAGRLGSLFSEDAELLCFCSG